MTEGKIVADGRSVVFNHPEMEGLTCEVQHSLKSGKPFCPDPGLIGVGVVVLPTGQPRLVLQIKHADGTSVSATLKGPDLRLLLECLDDAAEKAEAIAKAATTALRQ